MVDFMYASYLQQAGYVGLRGINDAPTSVLGVKSRTQMACADPVSSVSSRVHRIYADVRLQNPMTHHIPKKVQRRLFRKELKFVPIQSAARV